MLKDVNKEREMYLKSTNIVESFGRSTKQLTD